MLKDGEHLDRGYILERGELEVRHRGPDGAEQVLGRFLPGDHVENSQFLNVAPSWEVVAVRDSQLRTAASANVAIVIKGPC